MQKVDRAKSSNKIRHSKLYVDWSEAAVKEIRSETELLQDLSFEVRQIYSLLLKEPLKAVDLCPCN